MADLFAVLAAYLMGSIPFAQLLSKRRGIDRLRRARACDRVVVRDDHAINSLAAAGFYQILRAG